MSAPVNERLSRAVIAYLQTVVANPPPGSDPLDLDVSVRCVKAALRIRDAVPASDELERVWEAGKHVLGPTPEEPRESETDRLSRAEAFKAEGNAFFTSGNYHAAIAKFSDAIAVLPTPVYFSNRAACYNKLKEWKKAEQDARRAIELEPKFVRSYSRLAAALWGQGRREEAVTALERGAEDNPSLREELDRYRHDFEAWKAEQAGSSKGSNMGAMAGGLGQLLKNMMGGGAGPAAGSQSTSSPRVDPPPADGSGPAVDPAAMASMLGGMPGLQELLRDPEIARLASNPRFAAVMQDIMANGAGALFKYMADPEVGPIISKIMGALLPAMGGAGGRGPVDSNPPSSHM